MSEGKKEFLIVIGLAMAILVYCVLFVFFVRVALTASDRLDCNFRSAEWIDGKCDIEDD